MNQFGPNNRFNTHGSSDSTTAKLLLLVAISFRLVVVLFSHPFHAQDISETTRPVDLWTQFILILALTCADRHKQNRCHPTLIKRARSLS